MSIWKNVEEVKQAIASGSCRSDVIKKLNRSVTNETYKRLKAFERRHNIDTSHYSPWNTKSRKTQSYQNRKLTNKEIFCRDSLVTMDAVKRRIKRDNLLENKCAVCPITDQWQGKPIVLHLDHKNGIHNDNRLENLCFLCPNCHSQTPTYCGRNTTTRVKKSREQRRAERAAELIKKHQPDINRVISSGIDFSKYGWSAQVARLLKKNPQKIKDWMTRYMPDFYNSCFHRNIRG